MTKKELVSAIIFKRGLTDAKGKWLVEAAIDDVFDILTQKILDKEKVTLSGFGTFRVGFFNGQLRVSFEQGSCLSTRLKRRAKHDNRRNTNHDCGL